MENVQSTSTLLNPAVNTGRTAADTLPGTLNNGAAWRVSNYRLALGWVMLGLWVAGLLALDWDIQWHVVVGRDGFWTPPHWMFYSTVAAAGVICLAVVMLETLLYYRRYPGISELNTTPVLRLFRGPLGFILAGFGMLIMVGSAPLDDYWHQIYGIDLEVWTPFHMMLITGIITANLGMIYLFASEMNRRQGLRGWNEVDSFKQALRNLFNPATIGLVVASAALVGSYFLLMEPTFPQGKLGVGDLKIPSYSLAVAAVPLILVALVNATGQAGTATLAGLVFLVLRLGAEAFMVWGVQTLAVEQGVQLRRGGANDIQVMSTIYPFFLFLAGAIVDLAFWLTRRWRSEGSMKRTMLVAGSSSLLAGLALALLEKPWMVYNNLLASNIFAASRQFKSDYWAAFPLAAVIAVLAGLGGLALATALRYTDR